MALLFMDGFDHYATADLLEKWSAALVGSFSNHSIGAVGRRGSNGYRANLTAVGATSYNIGIQKTLTPSGAGFVIGMAMRISAAPTNYVPFLYVLDGATEQCGVALQPNLTLTLMRGGSGLVSSTATLSVGVMSYIELRGLVDPTAGNLAVQVDGSATGWPTYSGNTRVSANSSWNSMAIGTNVRGLATSAIITLDFDDVYVLDRSGPAPWNDFFGDCRVSLHPPTGAGATTGWTPSAGTNHAAIDDVVPNDDADYVQSTAINQVDTFSVPDAPLVGSTLYGVQLNVAMKKTVEGVCAVAPMVRHSGVDYVGTNMTPSTDYAYRTQILATNPGTSAQWTEADFNAAEFGYKKTV